MKRARVQSHSEWSSATSPLDGVDSAIKEFRDQLFLWHSLGQVDASKICTIAHYCTLIGGKGLEDLSVQPKWASKNSSALLKLIKGRTFEDTDLYYCQTPMFDKKGCQRVKQQHPMRLPSSVFTYRYTNHIEPLETLGGG
jgi:hypothetical protein